MKNNTAQILIGTGLVLLIIVTIGIFFFGDDYVDQDESSVFEQTQNDEATVTDSQNVDDTNTSTMQETSGGFELSSAQMEALVSLGIDPEAVPSTISAEQETCFVEELGPQRVEEIKAGDVPNALEFVKARSCI